MVVTYKDFKNLRFPLFVLPSTDWYMSDGVLFLEEQVLDERNMPGATLGIRRLQCRRSDLFPLKKAVTSLPSLLRTKFKYFIDSRGKPFIYEKTFMSALRSYKIKRIEPKDVASLLWVHEVPHPFTIERPPLDPYKFVRLLHIGKSPWMVYDYVKLATKPTYRRV